MENITETEAMGIESKGIKGRFWSQKVLTLKAFSTEAALIFSMIAYNLMSNFQTVCSSGKTQKTLSTLRYRTFAIGAYFEKVFDTSN